MDLNSTSNILCPSSTKQILLEVIFDFRDRNANPDDISSAGSTRPIPRVMPNTISCESLMVTISAIKKLSAKTHMHLIVEGQSNFHDQNQ
ncbi:MAG: hypothetical protein ACKPKO_34755, partial [Candidatus Fonsibacter sp.]